jgi:hypothetical protein
MSRTARRDFATIICCAVLLAGILWLFSASKIGAVGQSETECWWDGQMLYATGLPDEWSFTFELSPTGVTEGPSEFQFGPVDTPTTAYFWVRKGTGDHDAPRPPRQLRDYKVICWAVP